MREIKFRGKRIDTDCWVEGSLVKYPNGKCGLFVVSDWDNELFRVEVHPESVCQFTGLKDRNGKEIFEGDIVSSPHFEDAAGRQHKLYHIVEWSSRHHGWFLLNKSTMDAKDGSIQLFVADSEHLTVSGTIHDQGES